MVWKLQDFSVTHILRGIKVDEFRSSKSVILTHLEALHFDFCEFAHFLKNVFDQINKIQRPQMAKNVVLEVLHSQKLISRKI